MTQQLCPLFQSVIDVLNKTSDVGARQITNNTISPPCLVEGLIDHNQILQVAAETGGTWFACAMALGIAGGKKALSRFECKKPTGVVLLQGGMSHQGILDRLVRMNHGSNNPRIKLFSPELLDGKPDLSDDIFQAQLLSWFAENSDYKVLILDNVGGLISEKATDQMERLITSLRKASLTLISIESKGQKGIPISWGQIDTKLSLSAVDVLDTLTIRCDFEKARTLKPDMRKSFFIQLTEDEAGRISLTEAVLDEYFKAKTVQLSINGAKQKKIAQEIGRNQSTVSRWLKDWAIPESIIAEDGKGCVLTEKGKQLLTKHNLSLEV